MSNISKATATATLRRRAPLTAPRSALARVPRRLRRTTTVLAVGILTAAATLAAAAPTEALTASCTTGKLQEIGWADCTGSGGYFRVHLDCPWSRDYYTDWARLRSTNTHAQGTCEPWTVRNVYIETKPG